MNLYLPNRFCSRFIDQSAINSTNRFVRYIVLFIMLGSKFGGNLAVEDGKFGFQRFQLILLAPCAGGDVLSICRSTLSLVLTSSLIMMVWN